MSKKTNLEFFNEILFGSLKAEIPEEEAKTLEKELDAGTQMFFQSVVNLLNDLERTGYESDAFKEVLGNKANCTDIMYRLAEVNEQSAQITKAACRSAKE